MDPFRRKGLDDDDLKGRNDTHETKIICNQGQYSIWEAC